MRTHPPTSPRNSCLTMFLATLATCSIAAAQQTSPPTKPIETNDRSHADDIRTVLTKQANAWNDGDIDTFMETYWKSEQLTFSSGGKTTRGWTATRDRYKQKYTSRELMGKLTFSELDVNVFDNSTALVLGRWHLDRKEQAEIGRAHV